MEAGLTLAVAFDNGTILSTRRHWSLILPSYKSDVLSGINNALNLSTEAGYVVPENAPRILVKGMREALALAGESGFPESGTCRDVLERAVTNATILDQKVSQARERLAWERKCRHAGALVSYCRDCSRLLTCVG